MKFPLINSIETKDLRLVQSCLRVLFAKENQPPPNVETAPQGAEIIRSRINAMHIGEKDKVQFAQNLRTEAEQSLIPLSEFEWIKDNERACYWVWGTISKRSFPVVHHHIHSPLWSVQSQALTYKALNLKATTSSSDERLQEITKFFDRVNQPLEWQLQLLEWFKAEWSKIFSARKPFPWLISDDSEQCDWAWNYISNTDNSYSTPDVAGFGPVNGKEKYLAIYAAYDCWEAAPDSKKLFCHNFNKAWHQKKHRESRQGKKVCNLVLREDVKRKLDQMADERRITRNRLIEILIDNEYSNKTNY